MRHLQGVLGIDHVVVVPGTTLVPECEAPGVIGWYTFGGCISAHLEWKQGMCRPWGRHGAWGSHVPLIIPLKWVQCSRDELIWRGLAQLHTRRVVVALVAACLSHTMWWCCSSAL